MQEITNQNTLNRISGADSTSDYMSEILQDLFKPVVTCAAIGAGLTACYITLTAVNIFRLNKEIKKMRNELQEIGIYDEIKTASNNYAVASAKLALSKEALAKNDII